MLMCYFLQSLSESFMKPVFLGSIYYIWLEFGHYILMTLFVDIQNEAYNHEVTPQLAE